MNLKKALPLVVALILGLVAARMMVSLLHARNSAQAVSGPKLTGVVTASRDTAAGEELGSDNLVVGQIVGDTAPGVAFTDLADVTGRVAAAPMVHGQAVMESLLAPKGSGSGLQAIIPHGMRAVTVDVNEVSGVAGFIMPGSSVDVLQTIHDAGTNQTVARALVQNVKVTAVGTRGTTIADANSAHSVTLLVTPRQAEIIELASTSGRARLVLRNGQDEVTDNVEDVTMQELLGSHGVLAVPAPAALPVQAAAPVRGGPDPFAPSTQPADQKAIADVNVWKVRVISAGEANVVNVRYPPPSAKSAVTGSDTNEVTAP